MRNFPSLNVAFIPKEDYLKGTLTPREFLTFKLNSRVKVAEETSF